MGIAQHRHQAELAQRAQVAGLGDGQGGGVAAGGELQRNVVRQQAVVAAPAGQATCSVGELMLARASMP